MAAAATIKRDMSPAQLGMDDGSLPRRKKTKVEEGSDSDDDSDAGAKGGKGKKGKGASSKQSTKKGSDSHPHECQYEGCDRRYTRAEHLHRHQLEHTRDPRYYKCDRPNCDFGCVRKDLLDRHLERHGKEGSNLWRRDHKGQNGKKQPRISAATGRTSKGDDHGLSSIMDPSLNGQFHMNGNGHTVSLAQPSPISPALANEFGNENSPISPVGNFQGPQALGQAPAGLNGYGNSASMALNPMSAGFYPMSGQQGSGAAVSSSGYYPDMRPRNSSQSALPAFDQNGLVDPVPEAFPAIGPPPITQQDNIFPPQLGPLAQQPQMYMGNADPMMDTELNQFIMSDWSFDPVGAMYNHMPNYTSHDPDKDWRSNQHFSNILHLVSQTDRPGTDGASDTSGDYAVISPSRSSTPVHKALSHTTLTKARQKEILKLIEEKFDNVANPQKIKGRDGEKLIFNGQHLDEGKLNRGTRKHLDLKPLERYYDSFWRDYSPQLPIIHPSLDPNAEDTPLLLLLSMIAIGAASLGDGTNSPEKNAECEIAAFIAWNVRTLVQNHEDLICPTETWVLQTLVLLEAFEKLFSSRLLHERAHQLHGLTIELVRRSECFEGPTTIEIDENDLSKSWSDFIEIESRKRATYTVFTTDAFHACMFAHKASIKFQEVELALPCSDNLWECRNAGSFFNAFQALDRNKTQDSHLRQLPTFQDILQRIVKSNRSHDFDKVLNNTELQHNRFAFKCLLAGVMSVHREVNLQASRSNCQAAFRNLERWVKRSKASSSQQAEEFTELYAISALAQINTRSNVVYLQQIACPTRILGKQVTNSRRNAAFKQVRKWVRGEFYSQREASGAVCCAARFLTHIFSEQHDREVRGTNVSVNNYSPQFDHFLHRPWAVYISMLCIWAYSYTLEGPLRPEWIVEYNGPNDSRAYQAANIFLERLSRIETPEELREVKELNRCLGILTIMANRLLHCQWELLREAGDRFADCGQILRRRIGPVDDYIWKHVKQLTDEERLEVTREKWAIYERKKKLQKEYQNLPDINKEIERMRTVLEGSPALRSEVKSEEGSS